jgi:hypothetical protein
LLVGDVIIGITGSASSWDGRCSQPIAGKSGSHEAQSARARIHFNVHIIF